ncbi:spatacsin-like [Saccostrea echinata]|uniref:spatacsin-like n=1 Tax=Saccostrea echinata TaxID=191078 RepID=UPI002A828CE2|nr:spatacsin-like [Saccostrea echinata]
MDEEEPGLLKCYIYKFRHNIDLGAISETYPCIRFRLLAVLHTDCRLQFVHLDPKINSEVPSLQGIRSFIWNKTNAFDSTNHDGSQLCFTITIEENNLRLVSYKLTKGSLSASPEESYSLTDVLITTGELAEDSTLKLLDVSHQHAVLQCEGLIIGLSLTRSEVRIIYKIPYNSHYQITAGILIILNEEQLNFSFYDLLTGGLVLCLDVSQSILHSKKPTIWKFSDDLGRLVFVHTDGVLWVLNIEEFTSVIENTVKVELEKPEKLKSKGDFDTYTASRIGDEAWREKLSSLFHKYCHGKGSNQWYTQDPKKTANSVITAPCSKSKSRRVSGFHKVKDEPEDSYVESKMVLPALDSTSCHLTDLMFYHSVVSLRWKMKDHVSLMICNYKTGTIMQERLSYSEQLILSFEPDNPHLILTPTHLACVIVDSRLQQEGIVSKTMMYAGASVADSLCHINHWGRCSVPINTLDIGLKHRQLDTVSFFLKSKENMFSNDETAPSSAASPSPAWTLGSGYHDTLMQLEPALRLLIQTMSDNMTDRQSVSFSRKLADITLTFLYRLLQDAVTLTESSKNKGSKNEEVTDLEHCLDSLLSFISEIRQCVRQGETLDSSTKRAESLTDRKTTSRQVSREQQNIQESKKDEVMEALMNNAVPELQTKLCSAGMSSMASMDRIYQKGMERVHSYLSKKKAQPAVIILANLGIDVDQKLYEIASLTVNPEVREFIIEECLSYSLSPQQASDVAFVHDLERATTQEHMKSGTKEKDESAHQKELELILQEGKEARFPLPSEDTCPSVLLDWVQHWDYDTRQLIHLEMGVKGEEDIDNELYIQYLLWNNRADLLIEWMKEKGTQHGDVIHKVLANSHCTEFTRQLVIRELFRLDCYGEYGKTKAFLQKLRSVGGPLVRSIPEFHVPFICFCVTEGLPDLLWHYCEDHRISVDVLQDSVKVGNCKADWLDMFVIFYDLAHRKQNRLEAEDVYNLSLSNSSWSFGMRAPSIITLLKQGQTITALATLMYSPTILQQLVSGNMAEQELKVIEEKLMEYPKLHGMFFSVTAREIPSNDITIYQLLKNNAAFDPSRLFGWQALNTLYSGEENMKQLPSFSQVDLVARYGYSERIRYTYYLKQGRPAFALLSFLSEEIDSVSQEVCPQRLTEAGNAAAWIGVRHYHNSQVACACVAFIEMMGQDSLVLRTLLQAGQEVLLHLNGNLTSAGDQRREQAKKNDDLIVSWLCACLVYKGQYAVTLLHQLEAAIKGSLKKDKIRSTSFEAGQKWTIAVVFCQLMSISWTTVFLETCAKADKWLSFLWFAQLHQYSKQQLQPLLYKFRCPHLKQHLHYVIENAESKMSTGSTPPVSQGKQSPSKDVRSSLYARIGLTKDKDNNESSSSCEEETKSRVTNSDEWLQHLMEVNPDSLPDDLFQVVFIAQATPSPWKALLVYSILLHNPVLAVLAACDQDSAEFSCLCGWSVAMMDVESHDQYITNHGRAVWSWGVKHFDKILSIYLDKNWMSTLATGLSIFLPESPLLPFCQFSAALNERRDYKQCKVCLEQFKEAMQRIGGADSPTDHPVYKATDWLQQETYHIIQHHLHHTTNLHMLLNLLKLLDSQSIVLVFKFDVIDFGQLARLLNTIVSAHVLDVNFKNLVSSKAETFQKECRKVMDHLIEKHMFKEARQIARESGINMDDVTIEENKWEKKKLSGTSLWEDQLTRRRFWIVCEERCKQQRVASLTVSQYFQSEADQTQDLSEKAFLYQLGHHWIENMETSEHQELGDLLYNKMWRARIENAVNILQTHQLSGSMEMSDDLFSLLELGTVVGSPLPTELLSLGKTPSMECSPNNLSEQEVDALQVIINELIDRGHNSHSCRLAAEFGVYNKDLAIVVSCIRLARGVADVDSLPPSMKTILTGSPSKHRHSIATPVSVPTLSSVVSMSSLGGMKTDFLSPDKEQIILTMETLENELRHGKKCCKRIVTCFLIACTLGQSYEDTVPCHEFDVLKQLLRSESDQKFRLAADYLSTTNLKSIEIASFLCDSIVEVYKVMFANATAVSKKDGALTFNPSEKSEDAINFVKLCPVPATLGNKLLEAMTSLSGEDQDIPKHILDIQTELLILAHLCHSSVCNMEGISNVLRAARVMTEWMEKAGEFRNMVRLLTGIGRFNEMIYVFDSLKHNEKFELLLSKGIEKEKSLKMAIIDYLKRYHPHDNESFDMVVHYFMMHREIGHLLETRAQQILEAFREIPIDSCQETQTNLQSVVQFYMDAAESYCKEGCMRHAQNCMKQARLVALQLHYLTSGVKVIHMSDEEADQFIKSHPKFSEALIVSESYNRTGCWRHALCHNVVINGDFRYLQELKRHIKLTSSLIKEVVKVFQQDPNRSVNQRNMERFIMNCTDLRLQIQLARELDLRGVLSDLQKKDCGSYVQDMMANS